MTITRTQLKSELSQRFQIASVAEITKVRRLLSQENADSIELSVEEANAVREWFEQNGTKFENASGEKKTKKSRKVRTDDEANKDAIVVSAQHRHSALLNAGAKTGVSEADDFQQTRQAGFVKRLEQHNLRDAELIEQQLMGLSNFVSQSTETIDLEELPQQQQETYLLGKEPEYALPPSGGIGFNI